jgi:hypothetical protein
MAMDITQRSMHRTPNYLDPIYESLILLPPFNTIRGTPKSATERFAVEISSLTEMVVVG